MGFDHVTRSVTFDRPVLPPFLDQVMLRRLAVGDSQVDVLLNRVGEEVTVHVVNRRGDLRVMTTS
jgi:hypothetical protein